MLLNDFRDSPKHCATIVQLQEERTVMIIQFIRYR